MRGLMTPDGVFAISVPSTHYFWPKFKVLQAIRRYPGIFDFLLGSRAAMYSKQILPHTHLFNSFLALDPPSTRAGGLPRCACAGGRVDWALIRRSQTLCQLFLRLTESATEWRQACSRSRIQCEPRSPVNPNDESTSYFDAYWRSRYDPVLFERRIRTLHRRTMEITFQRRARCAHRGDRPGVLVNAALPRQARLRQAYVGRYRWLARAGIGAAWGPRCFAR